MIDFSLLKIELLLCGLIAILFILDLLFTNKKPLHIVAIAGTFITFAAALFFRDTGTTFVGSFISDDLSIFFKILFLLNAFLVILLSGDFLKKNPLYTGEYFILLLSATLGMVLMASSSELITFYISLELMSISSYILSAYQKSNPRSGEAGLKYLLLGAMASGMLLFGISLLYGAAGTLHYAEIAGVISAHAASPILYLAVVIILAAMSFKIAVVPFHMWVPDVYEGAPTPVVAFFSVGTKIAGFAVLMRLFMTAFVGLKAEWGILMAAISAITIIAGNLLAIPQTNIKRFLGYSSIAQAGYVLIGLAMATVAGLSATMFYLVAYLFSNLAGFAVIIIVSGKIESDKIDDYKGLWKRSPILAVCLLISFMSLGGVPPLVGFFGKLYLFTSAVENGYVWLVAIGVLMSVVSIYYYLIVLKRVYIDPPLDTSPIRASIWENTALGICVAGTLIFGILPILFFDSVVSSVQTFLK